MIYKILLGLLVFIALVVALKALMYLFRNSWFTGFIRGVFGMAMLALAVVLGLLAWDFYSYRQLPKEQAIGSIRFSQLSSQQYRVDLSLQDAPLRSFVLLGDQWQLDTRIIRPKSTAARLGLMPLYRIERLNGRYFSIEDEINKPRSVHAVNPSETSIDAWKWLYEYHSPLFEAAYGTAIYLPMHDAAEFQLFLSDKGLVPRPINEAAVRAVDQFINLE
ncbi:MAG: cation/multidrug efflux pump [Cellvibrio sp.]